MLTRCRLCLSKDANFVISNGQAAVRIISLIGLDLDANDRLPQLICQVCRLRLEEFHHFRKRCHAADRRLRYLKQTEGNFDWESNDNLENYKDDIAVLNDIVMCSPTTCSESNARWRLEASQVIQKEIDDYKKDLLTLCKQQVREEIEQQVRREIGELLLTEARNECRLNVLDELFYEIESFFVHKRNSIVSEQKNNSDGFASDLDNAEVGSTSCTNLDRNNLIVEPTPSASFVSLDANDEVEVIEVDTAQTPEAPISKSNDANISVNPETTPTAPIAMVEINMQNVGYNHLRDDFTSAQYLIAKGSSSPAKSPRVQPSPQKMRTPNYPKQHNLDKTDEIRSKLCQKHETQTKKQNKFKAKDRNFYRCRLRGSQTKKLS